MIRLNNTERYLLRLLLAGNKNLESFTLFRRMKVSFSEFSSTLRTLKSKDLINEQDNRIFLSVQGMQLTFLDNTYNSSKKWREIPHSLLGKKIDINEPYIPNIKKLDIETFPLAIKFLRK